MLSVRPSPVYPRFLVGEDGSIIGPSGKSLVPMIDPEGYQRVSIYLGNKKWKRVGVHRIVCETFHGLKPEWADLVAHRNGDPADNRAVNLKWATFKQNEADKKTHARDLAGERHHSARLTEDQVRDIQARPTGWGTGRALAREFGVTESISGIRKGKSWRHLS
jgi:hypothetical protein